MKRAIVIEAKWDEDAGVWLATSSDVPGLVIETDTWPALIGETRLVLPDLLALNGQNGGDLSITFRAEHHLEWASA